MFGQKKNNKIVNYQKNSANPDKDFAVLLRKLTTNQTISDAELKTFAYACIQKRAEVLSGADIFLYRKQSNKLADVQDDKLDILLNKVNVYGQSLQHILHFVSANLDIFGNAFVRIILNKYREPVELLPLLRRDVTIVYTNDFKVIKHYVWNNNGMQVTIPSEEMLHFKIPNPMNVFEGKATIEMLRNWIDIDYLQTQYMKNYFTHDATPHTVLESEQKLDKTYTDELEQKWIDKFRGIFNKFRPIILSSGLKLNKLQSNPKESDTINTQKMVVERTLAVFGVPKPIMAITDQVNYANASAGLKSFLDFTIKPFAKLCFEAVLTDFVKRYYNMRYVVKFDYSFAYDLEMQLKEFDVMLRNGVYTRNEVREARNYGAIESDTRASKLLIPTNVSETLNNNKNENPNK